MALSSGKGRVGDSSLAWGPWPTKNSQNDSFFVCAALSDAADSLETREIARILRLACLLPALRVVVVCGYAFTPARETPVRRLSASELVERLLGHPGPPKLFPGAVVSRLAGPAPRVGGTVRILVGAYRSCLATVLTSGAERLVVEVELRSGARRVALSPEDVESSVRPDALGQSLERIVRKPTDSKRV